jgi:4-amino-4-deoxychorismate lyase
MKYCSVNGIEQTSIGLSDRGLAYGDGIFTTAKIRDGEVVLLDRHLDRLSNGCQHLKIAIPSLQHLANQLQSIAESYSKAVLKVMITAGAGGRGYSRIGLNEKDANIIIIVSEFPIHYNKLAQQGIKLGNSKQRIAISPMLAGIKHLNRLEQVLLRDELDERKEDDLVVTNYKDYVVEATCANLFYWQHGQLHTPDLTLSGVNGIIRQEILRKYPETQICQTTLADLNAANGMFICNSLMGIMPVKKYNDRKLTIDESINLQSIMKGLI